MKPASETRRATIGEVAGVETDLRLPENVERLLAYYPRAERAAQYARRHYAEPIRLSDVARAAGMTTSSFSRFFAQKIGISYSALVKIYRVRYAQALLLRQDAAIGDVARAVGYRSACAFARAFKEVTGSPPTRYRHDALRALREHAL